MSFDSNIDPLVFDNGSGISKSGMAGDDAPRSVIPTIAGTPKYELWMSGFSNPVRLADEAQCHRGVLQLEYLIQNGVVKDWDLMEQFWHHVFYNELRKAPEEYPVLLTEAALNPRSNREKMAEIMLEHFTVPGFYVARQAVLALYASGRGSAVVLDCGDGATHVVPVYEGYTKPSAILRMDIAGHDLTSYLARLLHGKDCRLTTSGEHEVARDIKEQLCYVAADYDSEVQVYESSSSKDKDYHLPDGRVVSLDRERIEVAECLFKPSRLGTDIMGIHDMLYKCITNLDIDIRKHMLTNVVLSGGTTMLPGFGDRIEKEIKALVPSHLLTKVISPPERKYSVWIGGSILASLSTFQQLWVTQAEYQEFGPSVVHRRCLT